MTAAPSEPAPEQGALSDSALLDRALRARDPDVDAAYTILGKQHPVEKWVAVLRNLERYPKSADLELVAHSTLGRPPAVIKAVLALARAKGTTQAAFLAKVIERTRDEEPLIAGASTLRDDLRAAFDLDVQLAGGDAMGALYYLLASPLGDQAVELRRLAPDPAFLELIEVIRAEYERLQEVSRDTRWRRGSYRHLLRHGLADMALIARVGGRTEEQAFRLLQLRTEDLQGNRELLEVVDDDIRARYLKWALERASVESSTERAVFAIGELSHFPSDVDRKKVGALLSSKEPEVATAAAEFLVRSDPSDGSNDGAVAELLDVSEPAVQQRLVDAIVDSAPDRVRVDLWPAACDVRLAERATGRGDVADALLRTASGARDSLVAERVLGVIARIGESVADNTQLARAVVDVAIGVGEHAIRPLVEAAWIRPALWEAATRQPQGPQRSWLDSLVERDEAAVAAGQLASIFARETGDSRDGLEDYALEAVADGRLAAEAIMKSDPPQLRDALVKAAETRLASSQAEVERLRRMTELGDRAALAELAEGIEPLVTRAVERSSGNDRLRNDYSALLSTLDDGGVLAPSVPSDQVTSEALAGLNRQIAPVLRLEESASGVSAHFDASADTRGLLRPFALVDQLVSRGPDSDTARAARSAIADAMADAGAAQELLSDLFERGELFQAALSLSPDARTELLRASVEQGFEAPADWREHDALGEWFRAADSISGPGDGLNALVRFQRFEGERRRAEAQLSAGRAAARRVFVTEAARPLEDLEDTIDAYVQLWLGLGRLGIRQIAALGQVLSHEEIDPEQHEVLESRIASSYVVRAAGVAVGDEIVRRARVEAFA